MSEQEIRETLDRITAAAGCAAVGAVNPCGMVAHHEAGHDQPWVLADDWHHERHATPQEAERAAREWLDTHYEAGDDDASGSASTRSWNQAMSCWEDASPGTGDEWADLHDGTIGTLGH